MVLLCSVFPPVPSLPGPIKVLSVNTSAISLTWGEPANMTAGTYNFNVTSRSHASDAQNLTAINNSIVIDHLTAGTEYNISVATIGANSLQSNFLSVTQYTEPEQIPISNMTVENQGSTNSLKVTWHTPPGNVENYTIHVQDHRNLSAYDRTFTVFPPNTSYTIINLQPGRCYTITVATNSGPHSIASEPVSGCTKPNPVTNVQVTDINSTSVKLQWDEPLGADTSYTYRVQTEGYNQSGPKLTVTVPQLKPGKNFAFSVFSQTENGMEGSPATKFACTDAASVDSFTCEPVERQDQLALAWDCPEGEYISFRVQASPLSMATGSNVTKTYSQCPTGSTENLTGLRFGTKYELSIISTSCGRNSQPVSKLCQTSITDPPKPAERLPVTQLTVSHNSLVFTFLDNSFDSTNGRIQAIAVVVGTEKDRGNEPDKSSIGNMYSDNAAAYITYLVNRTQTARASNITHTVTVGNGEKVLADYNGKLHPLSKYRLSLVGFTHLKLTNTNRINITQSFFTSYLYSNQIQTPQDPGVIAGAVVGTLLGLAVVLLLVFGLFYWRRRRKQERKDEVIVPITDIRVARNVIQVDHFENYYNKQHADTDCGFAEEFEDLKPLGTKQSTHAAQEASNRAKNRYNNVLPYDVSRVKLSNPASDYINANLVPGYNRPREFIAAQGPLPGTVVDFWQMVWEKRVPAIVMLTKCVEQGRTKCEEYWPTDQPLTINNTTVSLTSEILLTDWTIRDFKLEKATSGERRTVRHFHFLAWPDHNVPNNTQLLLDFRDLVRQYLDQHPGGPTVVHCSAGVGRTGTFISVDRLMYQIDNDNSVDIFGTVCDLRMHRTLMVQTESQYVFLNRCAKDYIESRRSQGTNSIYENAPDLIYQNYSAVQSHGTANGHAV
uniref:protein-tyrosine-phosphatase n=1 Tax=Callorhinchus milii TaxID=7868 RepID=A0A4W3I2U0_CALMI